MKSLCSGVLNSLTTLIRINPTNLFVFVSGCRSYFVAMAGLSFGGVFSGSRFFMSFWSSIEII